MINPQNKCDDSLAVEFRLTARVLTHKLSACTPAFRVGPSDFSVYGLPSGSRWVPPFPMNELWTILNSLNSERKILCSQDPKLCTETASGVCVTTEAKSCVEDEEEKPSVKDTLDGYSPILGDKDLGSVGQITGEGVTTSAKINRAQDKKTSKYEKKNIYYKAIFRDIRKYFIEKLNASTEYLKLKKANKYKAFEPSIKLLIEKLLSTENIGKSETDVTAMAQILAPYLNYNEYMVSFSHKSEKDAHVILDCLQNFTLTKMRKVLQFSIIKFLVKYYCKHTVHQGNSARVEKHKTMKKSPSKYLEVLQKILDICDSSS